MSKVILGGGISGLSTAFYLSKKYQNGIALYEASDRLGGWIKTRKSKSGAIFEQGARTMRYSKETGDIALDMIDEIGLSSSVRPPGKGFSQRFIYIDKQICLVPSSFTALFKTSPLFKEPLLVPLLRDVFGKKKCVHDESVYDFIFRRFGNRFADVLSAVVCGVYAGNARDISAKCVFKSIFTNEQEHGSVIKGVLKTLKLNKKVSQTPRPNRLKLSKAWSFENGMESLPNALGEYLMAQGGIEIHLNKTCSGIDFKDGKALLNIDGKTVVAEHLYSSLPSNKLCKLLSDEHKFLRDELSKIPYVSVAVVNLEYTGSVLPIDAFGILVPPCEKLPILGIIFDSCIYPEEDKTVLTAMLGGAWFQEHFGSNPDPDSVLKIATEQVEKILKIRDKPISHLVSILYDCIPQYVVGHTDRIERINNYIAQKKLPMTLTGNSYSGVGIPDSILSAKNGVELQSA